MAAPGQRRERRPPSGAARRLAVAPVVPRVQYQRVPDRRGGATVDGQGRQCALALVIGPERIVVITRNVIPAVSRAARSAGLDPMVGYLHRHRWGWPALALDLMEEFRPITVDVAVWRCISTRIVRPEQFHDEPGQGCRMGEDAKHAFLAAYERRMLTLTTHPGAGRRVSFRVALSLQAKALARTLLDAAQPYLALRWK